MRYYLGAVAGVLVAGVLMSLGVVLLPLAGLGTTPAFAIAALIALAGGFGAAKLIRQGTPRPGREK
ncbi:MAG: hypothetical protein EOO77_26380 [Oxalobacteraceae bacterium]|nr:MAG: hypothetical protein EOO77_26380 [Oxalobacteraceae bacterium]